MTQKNYNLNQLWGELIIEELVRNGIDYFCISPGSRSTPLVAAAARNRKAKKIICFDERGNAFHALGYSQASGKPAAIITTSGTAVANLFPAVVEAYQNKIPMIVLTADRPHELLDAGANQTINQINIFGMYARWHFSFPCPDENINPRMVLTTIDYAVYSSLNNPSGPVHINCRFREPLEPDENADINKENIYKKDIKKWSRDGKTYTSYNIPKKTASISETLKPISEIINNEKRGLISVGRLKNINERESVLSFIKKLGWPVYADITSGLRLNSDVGSNIIKHFDQEILSDNFNKRVAPKTVIHFGEGITSKRFDQFLNHNTPENYIIVKNNPVRYDPMHLVTMHIETDINSFCDVVSGFVKEAKENSFRGFYEQKAKKVKRIIDMNIGSEKDINEVFVSSSISALIPDKSCLFLSNSMPIRDMELYGQSTDKEIFTGTNRGVSGIDGIISTAIGFSSGYGKICTLLIGDLAFLHDLNALATINSLKTSLIIVLINNNGGGIFDFLPISKFKDIFEDYFVTPHNLNFEGVAETFKINYSTVNDCKTFSQSYINAIEAAEKKNKSSLIEVITDREYNLKLRRRIKMEILNMLEE